MEAMGIIGLIFGLTGLSFGIGSRENISRLRIDIEDLKSNLWDAGVLKDKKEKK